MEIFNEFFTGINYWGSKEATKMWENFDLASIENDFRLLSRVGITHLRVFPLWSYFQPLQAIYTPSGILEYRFGDEPLPDTPAGKAGVSEEACEKFLQFCAMAEKYALKLIVGVITGHMSFRNYFPAAFNNLDCITNPAALSWEVKYAKYFVRRFQNQKAIIAWDLGNEAENLSPRCQAEEFYVWSSLISDAIKSQDSTRPVISGYSAGAFFTDKMPFLCTVRDFCDINTVHPYPIFNTATAPINTMKAILDIPFSNCLSEGVTGLPTFPQEVGAIGYMNCSYQTEAAFYRGCLLTSLAHGCHGFMWWCAFDQGHLNIPPYDFNDIGSDYGFFDQALQPKPITQETLRFKELLSKLPEKKLPPVSTNTVVLIPRKEGRTNVEVLQHTYLLAERAGISVSFCYLPDQPIPDAKLYLLPSVAANKAVSKRRLDQLLEKVKNGAVLYISLDSALMRNMPQLTGVQFAAREQVTETHTILFGDSRLPVHTNYKYQIEAYTATPLAFNEKQEPVFFKNAYGKGFIYFLTCPLEKSAACRQTLFHGNQEPPFEAVYQELANGAGLQSIAVAHSPFILLTTHPINSEQTYVFAINYNSKAEKAGISLAEGYSLKSIWGNNIQNGELQLAGNDGALFIAEKK